jgi:hypothetical protein
LVKYKDAISYDLIFVGYSIGDIGNKLSWYQLKVFLAMHSGAYSQVSNKSFLDGTTDKYVILLGSIIDILNNANWQRTGKKSNKPKSIFKNNRTINAKDGTTGSTHFGKNPVKINEMLNFLTVHNEKLEFDELGNLKVV